MLNSRLFRLVRANTVRVSNLRCLHPEFSQLEAKKQTNENEEKQKDVRLESGNPNQKEIKLARSMRRKYKIFREEDCPKILDIYEEREQYQSIEEEDDGDEDLLGLNLKRGLTGVFDIEELVDILRDEYAEDIFVCSVPKELKYVDYMVICSGRSYRHMLAIAEFVRRVFKVKREKGDILPKIEGEKSRDWMAMDLGNIALHIFSPVTRETYDLESLWAIGIEYDREFNKPRDPLVDLFERHTNLLADIKPQK